MAEFTDADVGLAPSKPVEFSDADIGLAPAGGSPVTQAFAPAKPIPLDPANTPSFSSDVQTGLNQTSQALNAQSATAANISIDQLNAQISYLEQGQPNHPVEYRMPEPAKRQLLTRLMRERDAKTQQFSGSVTALGQDAAAAKSIPVNTGLQEVGKAKTVGEAFSAIGENPWEVTRGLVGQSLPAAIPIIVSTILGGPLGGTLAGMTTGAITGGGSSALKVLNDNQIDTSNPEAVKAALADPAISEQVRRAFTIGAGVDAGVGAVTGGVGGMGFNVGSTPARTIMANAGIQAGTQGTIAAGGEAGKQLSLDGELTAGPLVMQALGQAVFAPVEGARATWAVAKTRVSERLGRPATDAEVINDPQAQQTLREAGVTDEQILTAAEAAGITSLDNEQDRKRFAILQDRLAKRRIEESLRPAPDNYGADGRPVTSDDWRDTPKGAVSPEIQRRQDELANRGQVDQETTTQNGVTAQTARATEDGTINPQASNVVPRQPDTRPIAVQPDGGAYRADDGVMQGRTREQVTRDARTLRLPAPGREVLTDAEIALQRAQLEGGRQPGRDVSVDGERTTQTRAPDTLYGQEGRAPQTRDQGVEQRQSGEAFTMADRQRGRADVDVRDTQVAGRPEGANPQQVYLDDGFPVEVVSRTMMPDSRGNMVEVATVRRYDPRTGKPEADAVEYQIPVRQLKSKSYAAEPRMAQDFEARAETDKINAGRDRGKRMDDAQGLPRQTYRQTAPDADPNASGRYTRPEQPDGPSPFKKWSNYEEAMRDFKERQERGQTEPPKSGPDYSKATSSNQARDRDRDGRFVVDENGHVMSSAQGPIRFADHKQAARWILNVGQELSPDQIFEIAVHPTGKGFTARERGRSESPPPGGKAGPEAAAQPETNRPAQPETPRGLEGPRAERAPEPEPAPRAPRPSPDQSFDEKVRAERDRLWAEDMGRASRNKASNDRAVESAARENVMRQEVGPEIIKDAEVTGAASRDDITDIAQLYRRKEGQSPQEAWEDAYAKWVDKGEQEAMRDANLYTQEDIDFDTLKVDSNSDAAKMGDVYTQEAQRTAREQQISRDSADNIPFDEVPSGKRETSRAPDEAGRQDAQEQSAERGGTRQETGGGREGARDYATDAGPDGGRQTVVPGAERDTRGANQRRADAPLRGGDEAPPHGGLFDEDARNQGDIFDAPRKPDRAAGDPRPFDDEVPATPKATSQEAETTDFIREIYDAMKSGRSDAWLLPNKDMDGFRKQLEADGWKAGKNGKLDIYTRDGWTGFVASQGPDAHPIFQWRRLRADEQTAASSAPPAGKPLTPVERAYAEIQSLAKKEREGWTLAQEAKAVGLTEAEASSFMTMGKNRREPTPEQRAKLDKMLDARDSARAKSETAEADILKKHGVTQKQWDSFQDKMGRLSDDKFRERHDDIVGRGSTFYSNPFLDPAAWKGLGKMLGLHSGYVRHMRAMFNDIKDMRDGGSSKKTWTMTDIGRALMWSNDGQLGALEKAYNSPTIAGLRDWLHPEADMGRQGTSPKRGYHEATDIRTQDNLNKLSNVLEPFEDNKSAKDQIVRLIQNPGNIKRGTPIHDAAASIRSMLDDELQYLKAAGVDISEIKSGGYWPRIIDAFRVLQNPEKFTRAASRQYLKDGLAANRTEADEMALAWLESVEMGGVGMRKEGTDFVMLGGTPNADFKRERVFGPSIEREANNPLREFYVQDPADVLTLHFQRTARRAEWAREMGDDLSKWKLKKDAIVKEGGIAALPQVVDLIANATGISKSYISPHARSAVSVVRSLGVFGTLSLAAASSIAETAMPAIRAGNPARLVGDVGRTIKALAGGMKNERAWAEDLGVIVNALGDSILGRRYHALEAGNKFQQRTMNRYFRMTGLEQLTTAQRVVAVAGAQAYLRRQAINLTDGGKRTKSAQDFLSELGVSGKDAEGFSKWLLEQADGKPTSASVKDDGHYGSMYRTAMHRFIRQTNMDPNTSTRPAWANDPYKSLMFQLNSYTWAFQKNVLNRAGAGIVKGVTGKGYTMQDRMAFLAPAMMLPVLYAIQAGVGEVRDNIFADPTAKPKDDNEKRMRNLDRAGAFGQASPLMNFITGVRYERDLASSLAGPALGNLLRPIESWIKTTGDRNSPNTNTRERALAKDMYRGFVFPVIAGTMAAAAPMGVGALAIQALNTGAARNAFTSAVAGPKPPERRGPPRPPQPQRPTRPTPSTRP